jgi:hypothetical protein
VAISPPAGASVFSGTRKVGLRLQFDSLCVGLLLASLAHLDAAAQGCPRVWSAPADLLTLDGRRTFVGSAQLVHSGGMILVGAPSMYWATPAEFDPAPGPSARDTAAYLRRLQSNHGYIGIRFAEGHARDGVRPPPLPGSIVHVATAADRSGGAHVVWLVDPSGEDRATRVMYSRLSSSGWTTPAEIFQAEGLHRHGTGPQVVFGDSTIHVLVSFTNRETGSGIAHITGRSGHWTSALIKRAGLPASPVGALVNDTTMVVAFTAGDVLAKVDNGSHVFLANTLQGFPQRAIRRLNWAGMANSRWPFLFRAPGVDRGRAPLHLLWTVTRHAEGPDSLFIATSTDGGLGWSSPDATPLERGTLSLGAAIDSSGRIHVTSYSERAPGRFLYKSWFRSTWSDAVRLPFGAPETDMTLSTAGDSLLLFWGERRAASPTLSREVVAPITRFAILAPTCAKTR